MMTNIKIKVIDIPCIMFYEDLVFIRYYLKINCNSLYKQLITSVTIYLHLSSMNIIN